MAEIHFFGWERSGAADTGAPDAGRLKSTLALTLTTFGEASETANASIPFHLMGPGDVVGLQTGAVTNTYPQSGAIGVETTKSAYVEFAEPDLPWRYTPEASAGKKLRPWLILVVGSISEITLRPNNRVLLAASLQGAYNLALSARWAHLQDRVARVLSPRALETNTSYRAVLIPAFKPDGGNVFPTNNPLPVYYTFTFHTTDTREDFKSLALKIDPICPPEGLGVAPVAFQNRSGITKLKPLLKVRGALTTSTVDAPLPNKITKSMTKLRSTAQTHQDRRGRPIIQLPNYGEPWVDDLDAQPWSAALNLDPRHRGVAGLGAWAGILWQEEIVDAAAKKMGALKIASQRINQLTTGLLANRALWSNRLPADDKHQLMIFGSSMARMTSEQGQVLEQVTGADRPFPPALFTSAARRMLRPGTTQARLMQPGAADPSKLLDAINNCERIQSTPLASEGLPHPRTLVDLVGEAIKEVDRAHEGMDLPYPEDAFGEPELIGEGENTSFTERDYFGLREETNGRLNEFGQEFAAGTSRPERPCRPVDTDGLAAALNKAISPMGDDAFVIQRVLATITGLDSQPLTPPELWLDFDLPAWRFLREHAVNWLLPGVNALMPPDETDRAKGKVTAVATNQTFIDAFLVGLNQQALNELRFRNIPIIAGCTPFHRFWERVKKLEADGIGYDITDIKLWQSNTPLGDPQHETEDSKGTDLVLVFKTELFRRYPDTLVYLSPRDATDQANNTWVGKPDVSTRILPTFPGVLARDLYFFGFNKPPSILDTHWLIIEQVPRGFSFYNNVNSVSNIVDNNGNILENKKNTFLNTDNGADFGHAAFADPVRVVIQGTLMNCIPD